MDISKAENSICSIESKGESTSELKNGAADSELKYNSLLYCRTCASKDAFFVPIFKGEGLNHQLNLKIGKYLPINVTKDDDLPLQLCYNCASTIIAWDTLVIGCVEAEKKLRALKNAADICLDMINEKSDEPCTTVTDNIDSDDEPLIAKKLAISKESIGQYGFRKITKNNENEKSLEEAPDDRLLSNKDFLISSQQNRNIPCRLLNIELESSTCLKIFGELKKVSFSFQKSLLSLKDSLPGHNNEDNLPDKVTRFLLSSEKSTKEKEQKAVKYKGIGMARCEDCGKTLSSRISLNNHRKIHSKGATMTCHVCGVVFRHRFSLVRHLKVIHEGLRKYSCVDCGKKYRSEAEMKDHRNVHDNKQKIVCEECGRIFLTKASFYPHIKSHRTRKLKKSESEFACDVCDKTFTTKKSKNQHKLIHTGEKPIMCGICTKSFRTKANYSQHKKIHSGVKPFACEHCKKRFGRKDHLTIHVRCHTGEKPFICSFCGRAFAQISDMKKHGKLHDKNRGCNSLRHGIRNRSDIFKSELNETVIDRENGKMFKEHQCPVCWKNFAAADSFCEDLYSHLENEKPSYTNKEPKKCRLCGKVFDKMNELVDHLLSYIRLKGKPSGGRMIKKRKKCKVDQIPFNSTCEICGKTISRKYTMKRHLITHSGEKRFTCHHCGKQYAQESGLQRHLLVVHEGIRKYKCPICSKIFGSNYELKTHQYTHTDPRPFQCDQCGRTFICQKHLYHHRKYHHTTNGLRQLCKICNRYFSSPGVLKRHHKVIHLKLKEFQCHVCSAQLSTKQYLQEHLKIHTDERPEVCSFCGKTFQMAGNLRQHIKIHMEKTQICDICGKGFTRRCHLLTHMGSHKGIELPQCEHCQKRFTLKVDLEKHIKSDHSHKRQIDKIEIGLVKEILVL